MYTTIYYKEHPSPLGKLILATTDEGICGIYFVDQYFFNGVGGWKKGEHTHLTSAAMQLDDYFAGKRVEFDLKLDLKPLGTPFQLSVWQALLTIPFGKTCGYARIAELIDNKDAARAVGGAIGRNPISIVIPCHRIVGSNGALTGYAGGLERKKYLLRMEGYPVT